MSGHLKGKMNNCRNGASVPTQGGNHYGKQSKQFQ